MVPSGQVTGEVWPQKLCLLCHRSDCCSSDLSDEWETPMSWDLTSLHLQVLLKKSSSLPCHHFPLQSPEEIQGLSFLQQHRKCSVSASHQRHAGVPLFIHWERSSRTPQNTPNYHCYMSMISSTLPPCPGLYTCLTWIYHFITLRSTGAGQQIEIALSTGAINCRMEWKWNLSLFIIEYMSYLCSVPQHWYFRELSPFFI